MTAAEARERLAQLLGPGAGSVPLAEASLLCAVDEYPALDPAPYLEQIESLASLVEARSGGRADPVHRIASLRRVVFEDAGFRGNRETYYDPRNSYLNEVLDRRLGIPISLAILVLGVGRRLGWPLYGVNFPYHVLVRYGEAEPLYAIDAFHGGLILSEEELCERWEAAMGQPAPALPTMLVAACPRAILARMLNNLRATYTGRKDFARAALAAEKQLLIEPHNPLHCRDLGYYYLLSRRVEQGVAHLQRYLRVRPAAPDRNDILHCIQEVSESGIQWD
jgi:regulator of sirC expression with transglutaminase-like and TPR domain